MDRHRAALTTAALLALPLAFLAVFFAFPLARIFDQGLRPSGALDLGGITDVVTDEHLRRVVGFTVGQALLSTAITVASGCRAPTGCRGSPSGDGRSSTRSC